MRFLLFLFVLTAAAHGQTGLTVAATEGPYYVTGTAALTNGALNAGGLPGTVLRITGHVYAGASGTKPVANAKIELWQADDSGRYHPQGNGPVTKYSASEVALRGFITSAADGSYSFTTIYPGYYEGRARHLHFRVTAEGYQAVTSQLIFYPKAGDRMTYSTDSIAQSLPSYQLIRTNDAASPATGTFDIRLSPR